MRALQRCLERLMKGDSEYYQVSWETPLPPLESRRGALLGLRILDVMLQEAERELSLLVAEARFRGVTWQVVASTLGVGPQAAHKRLSHKVNAIVDLAQ